MKWRAKQKKLKKLQRKRNWTKAVAEGRIVRLPITESTASYYVCSSRDEANELVAKFVAKGANADEEVAKVLKAEEASSHWLWANN